MLLTPSLCHKLSHLLGPLPLERDVLYGRPLSKSYQNYFIVNRHRRSCKSNLSARPYVKNKTDETCTETVLSALARIYYFDYGKDPGLVKT